MTSAGPFRGKIRVSIHSRSCISSSDLNHQRLGDYWNIEKEKPAMREEAVFATKYPSRQCAISHPVKQNVHRDVLSYRNSKASIDSLGFETKPRSGLKCVSIKAMDSSSMLKPLRLLRGEITYSSTRDKDANVLHELSYRDQKIRFFTHLYRNRELIKAIAAHHLGLASTGDMPRCRCGGMDTRELQCLHPS